MKREDEELKIFIPISAHERMREQHNNLYDTDASIGKIIAKTGGFLMKSKEVPPKKIPSIAQAFLDTEYEKVVRFFVKNIWCFVLIPKDDSDNEFVAVTIEQIDPKEISCFELKKEEKRKGRRKKRRRKKIKDRIIPVAENFEVPAGYELIVNPHAIDRWIEYSKQLGSEDRGKAKEIILRKLKNSFRIKIEPAANWTEEKIKDEKRKHFFKDSKWLFVISPQRHRKEWRVVTVMKIE